MAENRQLILDLLARDKSGPASKSFSRNMDGVAESAEDAARATERLGEESDRAEDGVDRLGKSSRTAAQHVDKLDREIESVEKELRDLAVAFTEAATAAERVDLSKAIRRTERDLKQLNKSKGILGALLPEPAKLIPQATDLGAKTGGGFIDGFSQTASKVGPLAAVGVGMGLAIAPQLGATVAAGLLGGAGVGGVIGGLALASRDSRVKSYAKALGREIMGELDESAGAFVPAALDGIDEVRGSFRDMSGDLKSIFDNSSRYVGPVIRGLTGLIERTVDGAEKAMAGAQPVIEALERNLPRVGDALGDLLESLSDNGPEAAVALDALFDIIEGGIRTVGYAINGLTELYGALAMMGVLGNDARNAWIAYDVAAKTATGSTDDFAGAQGILADKTLTAAEAAEREHKAISELNKLLRANTDPLFAFGEAQEKVAESQAAYDKAIKEHGKNSKEARSATRDLASAFGELNDKASEIPTTADGKITPAFRRMLIEGGATERQIEGIEGELARLKRQADKYDGLNARAKFSADTGQAATRLGALLSQMSKVRSKHITVSVGVSGAGALAAIQTGRLLAGRAEGGPVDAGTPYIVGEKRPEVFVPKTAGTIVPSVGQFAGAGRSSGRSASRGGDDGWVLIRGDSVLDPLIRAIASQVSAAGGRPVQLGIKVG